MSQKYTVIDKDDGNKTNKILYAKFKTNSNFILYGDTKICLPGTFLQHKDTLDNFQVYDDDVWISGFPMSETLKAQELIWLLTNNLNYEEAKTLISQRSLFIDVTPLFNMPVRIESLDSDEVIVHEDSISYVDAVKSNRIIKSHLPWDLLPKQIRNGENSAKTFLIVREPKHVCLTYYWRCKKTGRFNGTLDEFCELFLEGKLIGTPYWSHILGYWNRRHQDNVFYLKQTDIDHNTPSTIKRVAKYLGKTLTDDEFEKLCDHMSDKNITKNPYVSLGQMVPNPDIALKEKISPEFLKKFDDCIETYLGDPHVLFDITKDDDGN